MVNEYEKAIGIWTHKIGEIEHKIIPKEGDNLAISRVMKMAKERGLDWLYDQFNTLYMNMVIRDEPIADSEKPKLKLWIEMNQVKIQQDMLVEFGWATKEQQEKFDNMSGEELKKLMNA